MPINILMPALSPTMKKGNLTKWHVKKGDKVSPGLVIADIETDKATMELESFEEGIINEILCPEGSQDVDVNSVIATLVGDSDDDSKQQDFSVQQNEIKPEQQNEGETLQLDQDSNLQHPSKQLKNTGNAHALRIKASPVAKMLAKKEGIDLSSVLPTGPMDRIVKKDVLNAIKCNKDYKNDKIENSFTRIPISSIRRTIATRLLESKNTIPHFYLEADCNMDYLSKARVFLKESNLTLNDVIIKSVASSMMKVPEINVSWQDDCIHQYHSADIAIAVAIKDGIITPIIRSAEKKTLTQISQEAKELISRAKDGSLSPAEYQGGNFTISNLGMFGVKKFLAIVNPPHSAILSVGCSRKTPTVQNDQIAISNMMSVSISVDHRVVDGLIAARFLSEFKMCLEDPIRICV